MKDDLTMIATAENPDLLPRGFYVTDDGVVIHDFQYKPIAFCPHTDEGPEWFAYHDGDDDVEWPWRFGTNATAVDADKRIEHYDHGFFHRNKVGDERTHAQVRKLMESIPELAVEIERRKTKEREEHEIQNAVRVWEMERSRLFVEYERIDSAIYALETRQIDLYNEAQAIKERGEWDRDSDHPFEDEALSLYEKINPLKLEAASVRARIDAVDQQIKSPAETLRSQKQIRAILADKMESPMVNNVAPSLNIGVSLTTPRGEILPTDSDDSLALAFAGRFANDLRYCEEWGKWLQWDETRWRPDRTSAVYDLVRRCLRAFAGTLALPDARKVTSAKTVAAVERMARTDQRIVTLGDMWDADPWLLNTPGGVVDLRTGVLRPASPSDHCTKITAIAPGGDCPTWRAFLHKSLAGDAELIGFVQRMLGYSLTGDTREHALFFVYGPGGNGKGVLLNTAAGILNDYNKTAPVDTFIDSPHERHPTDLAGLRGARLVTASETEKGRRWAESKIKMLTGGDRISARFMRQDFFEFVPQFKLVIAGNHKPGLRSVDEAIRRRLHLIPFTVNIPERERDTSLSERLKAEWGGILQWMIDGCLAWQRSGLQPPQAVRAATDEYLSGEDALGTWLDERCEQRSDAWTQRGLLYASWKIWAEGAGEYAGPAKQFFATMRQRGFEERKREGNWGFAGVKLPLPQPPKR